MMPHNKRGAVLGSAWLAAAVIIAIAFVLAILPMYASAVTLTWQNPATYTDGSPIRSPITSRIYCGEQSGEVTRLASTQDQTITLAPCAPLAKWIVKAEVNGLESDASNVAYTDTREPDSPVMSCSPIVEKGYRVMPWRTGDTMRNVYDAPGGNVIGQVPVGAECGEIVAPYRNWQDWGYGVVTPVGSTQQGVTVCKRK